MVRRLWKATFALLLAAVAGSAAYASDFQILTDAAAPREAVLGGLDAQFVAPSRAAHAATNSGYWLRLTATAPPAHGMPVVVVHAARDATAQVFAVSRRERRPQALALAVTLPGFSFTEDRAFALPQSAAPDLLLYVYLARGEPGSVTVVTSTLEDLLTRGNAHARVIALTFGALGAMAVAALLIWFVLKDKLFLLYASLFVLQALYIVYLSGQGFGWPLLAWALPLDSLAWNVPVGLSGAVACLFTREIADLQHTSAREYAAFGWFAAAFVVVTCANAGKFFGLAAVVAAAGNLLFLAASVFTVVVAFTAWRRGNRAAGWFLVAWGLLEGFTIAAALQFLMVPSADASPRLYYSGLPLSMVAAAVLIALGVADRLRQQRAALSDAERRAQTDPLTGVLNRRSLLERLDAACNRARARGLPISVLFIDLDHFKQINDSHGHPAGDACLRAIIDPIHTELRQSDVIGRYGGEEFVVILSSADAAAANPIAERILQRVAAVRVEGFGGAIRLTCSIGVAASDTLGVWGDRLIAQADAAVYAAKRAGRNQVHVARPLAA